MITLRSNEQWCTSIFSGLVLICTSRALTRRWRLVSQGLVFSVGYQELQLLRYRSDPIFSKTSLKKGAPPGGANVCFPYWLAGKKGHPTFEWRESIHANPEYTKKTETKYANELYYTAIPLYNLAKFWKLTQILFPDVLGNLELLWYRFWSIPQALSLPYAPASIGLITFLETNMLHLKTDGWKTIFLLGRFMLRTNC